MTSVVLMQLCRLRQPLIIKSLHCYHLRPRLATTSLLNRLQRRISRTFTTLTLRTSVQNPITSHTAVMGCASSSPRRGRGSSRGRSDSLYGIDLSTMAGGGFEPSYRHAAPSSYQSRSNASSSRRYKPRHAVDYSTLGGGFEPRSYDFGSYRSRPSYRYD